MNGWKTNRKIVVFESDDWGSIRLPDIHFYKEYKKVFPEYYLNSYLKYDSLASENDLSNLFTVLKQFKDKNGNHPLFTFNVVMTNPNFDKIKESGYTKYYNEPFTKTLQRYSQHSNSFEIWKKAIDEKLMIPQFHGREHVNVPIWLKSLKNIQSDEFNAFQFRTWSSPNGVHDGISLQASFDWQHKQPLAYQKKNLKEGLQEFESIFGFKSSTFIPNNYIFDSNLYKTLKKNGITGIQGMKYQKLSLGMSKGNKRKLIRRHLGDKNEIGLTYLVRNSSFEPSQTNHKINDVNECLKNIENAFFWNKPAIIDTHRLNYIGVYDEKNRDANLYKLEELIKSILKKWGNVEFMTSNQLIELITNDCNT